MSSPRVLSKEAIEEFEREVEAKGKCGVRAAALPGNSMMALTARHQAGDLKPFDEKVIDPDHAGAIAPSAGNEVPSD